MRALSSIKIADVEVQNRIVRTAHSTHFGTGGFSDEFIAYHVERARGGVGLTILEIVGVHPTSPSSLCSFDDSIIAGYAKFMEAIRPHGMKVFQQLWHAGHNGLPLDGGPPWSSCDLPSPVLGIVPHPMTRDEIAEIVAAYAAAARRCRAGGVDGVELHASHGYLPQQFMSPMLNRRMDDYGGCFENRMRFTAEVLLAIRAEVGAGYPVGVRLSPEGVEGGMTPHDVAEAAAWLEQAGLVDFIDVSMGGYFAFPKMIGAMHEPTGYELPTSSVVTAAVSVPRIVTGRFRTLEEAEQVLSEGVADLVGMTRAHIADSQIVRKTREGRVEEIRPCIGCNQGCVGQLLGPERRMGCTVNPYIGRESQLHDENLPPIDAVRRILVVGGGPAGLEAARIARLRGHEVILAEASADLGGQINIAAMAPRRQAIADIVRWQESEVYRLGVDVRLSTFVDASDLDGFGADRIILATGSQPRMDGVQMARPAEPVIGMDHPNMMSAIDLLALRRGDVPSSAVVIDDVGHYEAIAAAEHLISLGAEVTFVTRHRGFAQLLDSALIPEPALERMQQGRFTLLTRCYVRSFDGEKAVVASLQGSMVSEHRAQWGVFVSHNRPALAPFEGLDLPARGIVLAGDARSPRFLLRAIAEGNHAGCSV